MACPSPRYPPGRPAKGVVALSSVTCSVTYTVNLTFRLDQLILLLHIHINCGDATVGLRRETIRGDGAGRQISRRRRRDFMGTQHAWLAKTPNTTAIAAGGRKHKRFRQTKEGQLTTNVLPLIIISKKLDGLGNFRVPLLPAVTRWPLFGQQAHSIVLKSSAAGQLPTRSFG